MVTFGGSSNVLQGGMGDLGGPMGSRGMFRVQGGRGGAQLIQIIGKDGRAGGLTDGSTRGVVVQEVLGELKLII